MHRLGVALLRGREIEALRGLEVLLHALALFIKAAETELGGREAGLGGAFEPARGFFEALRNAASFEMAHGDLVSCGRIAADRRIAQGDREFFRRNEALIARGCNRQRLGGSLLADRGRDVVLRFGLGRRRGGQFGLLE